MFQELNAYLFQHKSISIPGLGTIYLETFSSSVDVADRTILPPLYQLRFDKYSDSPDREFFAYIATQRNVLDYEAIKWYNEFSQDLRNRIRLEEKVEWEGVGTLKKDETGNIIFEAAPVDTFLVPVPAVRVNRQNAQHTLLVGDQQRTNVEMNEWLLDEEAAANRRRRSWWIAAIVLAAAAVLALGWHFYTNGWVVGNQNSLNTPR